MRYLSIGNLHDSKDKKARKHYLTIMIGHMVLIALLLTGLSAASVKAASGIKIYDYTTKQTATYTGKTVKVICNNSTVSNSKYPAILVNGIALVPYNEVFSTSKINTDCVYNSKKGTLRISKNSKEIVMTIGSKKAVVNGKVVTLPATPVKVKYIASNKTRVLVPSRFVAEALGLAYNWYSDKNKIEIKSGTIEFSYNDEDRFLYTGVQGKVSVDGKNINLSGKPSIIIDNTAMLSADNVFAGSSIGADYTYNKKDKSINLQKDGTKLVMTVGSRTAYVNNKAVKLTTAPVYITNNETKNSYILVPGEFTASCLGYKYQWNNAAKTSILTKQKHTNNPAAGNSAGNNVTGGSSNDSSTSGSAGGNSTGNNSSDNSSAGGSSSGSNNSNNSSSGAQAGTSGDINATGNVLNQWAATTLQYGVCSGIYELNSDPAFMNINGYINYISRDYTNTKKNAETYQLTSNGPFQKVTSSKSGNTITIYAENMSCVEQSNQLYGTSSNFINSLSSSNDGLNNRAVINFNTVDSQYQYDLYLSADRTILYVTVYYNTITSAQIGTNNAGDYILLNGISTLSATSSASAGLLYIELPNTISSFGDINSQIIGAKYLKQITIAALPDKTQLILSLNDGYQLHAYSDGNQYRICFQTIGTSGSSSYPNAADSSSYEVVIPKPANFTADMISDEDRYLKNYFEITIKGDYTGSINNNTITNSAAAVSSIAVSLNNSGNTVIRFNTTKVQGYKLTLDADHIYLRIGDPVDIYKNIVVLDPGHGGSAPGAAYDRGFEKDLNFKILYTLGKKYFCQNPTDLKVYYTRTDDSNPTLQERAAFAEAVDADLFVSLHMNSAPKAPNANGTEVFYSKKNNTINSAGLSSQTLASYLVQNLTSELGTGNRGVKSDIFYVINSNTVPAVLIELGFLTNKNDLNLILDETCQETTAETIYNTLLQIFKDYPTGR